MCSFSIGVQNIGHDNGIRQAVRNAVLTAQGMRNGVDVTHIRHGKCNARFICGMEHVFACFVVIAVFVRELDVVED